MKALRVFTAALTVFAVLPSLYGQTAAPDITLPAGDPARGKAVFENTKGNCLNCHRVQGRGSLFAPELTAIAAPPRGGGGGGRGGATAAPAAGARAGVPAFAGDEVANARIAGAPAAAPAGPGVAQFAQSILDPNAVVSPLNRYVTLKMKDGKTVTGKLLSVDTFAYQIFDSSEKLANILKDNVREAAMTSPMPSYRGKLSDQELADVISYLMGLKGQ